MFNPFKSEGSKAGNAQAYVPSESDFQDAEAMIAGNPDLAQNERMQWLIQNDFINEEGRQLNPADTVKAALARLENPGMDVEAGNIAANLVEHSKAPEAEHGSLSQL
jgi:hypothetical protein